MARVEQVKMTSQERSRRYFSESFRQKKVKEIELGESTVLEISKTYQVSRTSIYRWIHKYSTILGKQERVVVERQSDTRKIEQLKKRIAELEQTVGQKQIALEFYEKMIELAEQKYGIDIKKKGGSKRSSSTGSNDQHTPIK